MTYKKSGLALAVISTIASQNGYSQLDVNGSSLEEIVVTGIKASLNRATVIKREAASVQDSIAAEDIGKFPDQNVAESLQRISGVAISRNNGEGSKITVRGFGPQFNVVKVNDRTLATTEAGRDFDFQVLASELIAGADVIKAPVANISSGSIGAYVNIKTARPLTNPGFKAAGSVDVRYSELAEETDPKFSGVISNTFANDTIGVLVGVSRQDFTSRIDKHDKTRTLQVSRGLPANLIDPITDVDGNEVNDIETFIRPGRGRFFTDSESRKRTGANLTLQFAPNEKFVTTFDVLYSNFSVEATGVGYQLNMQNGTYKDVVVNDNATLVRGTLYDSNVDAFVFEDGQDSTTYAFGLNSIVTFDNNLTLEFDVSHSRAEATPFRNEFIGHITNVNKTGQQVTLEMVQDGTITQAEYDQFKREQVIDLSGDHISFTNTLDFSDPSAVRSHWNDVQNWELEDNITEFSLDGQLDFDDGVIESVEAGIAYLNREKTNNMFRRNDLGAGCIACGGQNPFPKGLWKLSTTKNFLADISGDFPRVFPTIANLDEYLVYLGAQRQRLGDPTANFFDLVRLQDADSYINEEQTTSLFGQLNLSGELGEFNWSGNIGLRYVSTDTTASGNSLFLRGVDYDAVNSSSAELRVLLDVSELTPVTEKRSDNNLLPSINLALDFNNGLLMRAGAAKTITRPGIEDIGVNRSIVDDSGGNGGVIEEGGNPDLKPYEVIQFDLSFEYYANNGSAYSFAFFHKEIETFVEQLTVLVPFDTSIRIDPEILARNGNQTPETALTVKQNRDGGSVTGIELSGLHYFDYLPGFFSGFGVQANYTYAVSVDEQARPIELTAISDPGSAIEGFAKNAYNLVAFYDRDGFQARLAYNWRDTFLKARKGKTTFGLPEFNDAYGQLDLSLLYDINDNFAITAEVINLTNEGRLEYADIRERVTLIEYSGTRYQIGLKINF